MHNLCIQTLIASRNKPQITPLPEQTKKAIKQHTRSKPPKPVEHSTRCLHEVLMVHPNLSQHLLDIILRDYHPHL